MRLVACTNADLDRAVREGLFRTDLFYRLNVVSIQVPPLRDRPEDIPRLARHFVAEIASHLGRSAPELPPGLVARLRAYAWPGNVRELRNVLERALVLDPAHGLDAIDLPAPPAPNGEPDLGLKTTRDRLEREILLEARRRAHGVQKEAARLLGIDPRNLSYFLRKHGLAENGEGLMGDGGADARGEPPAPRTPAPGWTRTPR